MYIHTCPLACTQRHKLILQTEVATARQKRPPFPATAAPQTAMVNTKRLCAVILDSLGREIMVRRPCEVGPDGWPAHPDPMEITAGQQVRALTCPSRECG